MATTREFTQIKDLQRRTRYVAGALLLMTMSLILVKTGRDALYFQDRGIFDLPFAYIGIALSSLPLALGTLALMRLLGPRKARLVAPLIAALLLLAYTPLATAGGGTLNTSFFMMVPLVWGVLFSLAWLLAADLFQGAQTTALAQSYGVIGAASILGSVLGGGAARMLAAALEARAFFVLGALVLVSGIFIMARAQRLFPQQAMAASSASEPSAERRDAGNPLHLFSDRYTVFLFAVAVTTALIGILIEFQFYLAATMSGSSAQENVKFFANMYLFLNGAALLVQLAVMPRLQQNIGVFGSLLILPLALASGAAALIVAGSSALLRSGLRVAEGGLKSSIHRSNWEQAYLSVDKARRATAKIVIDGAGARLGEAVGAGLLWLWLAFVVRGQTLEGQDISWVTYTLLVVTLFAAVLIRGLGRNFSPSDPMVPQVPVPDS